MQSCKAFCFGLLVLILCFLNACHDEQANEMHVSHSQPGNSGGGDSTQLLATITTPQSVRVSSHFFMVINLTNEFHGLGFAQSGTGASFQVTSLEDKIQKPNGAVVDLFSTNGGELKVGSGGLCINSKGEGAKLSPNASCKQIIAIESPIKGEISGSFEIKGVLGGKVSASSVLSAKTEVMESAEFHSDNRLSIGNTLVLRPNSTSRLVINNSTQVGLGDTDLNGVYVDLSSVDSGLVEQIDKTSVTGGFYDEREVNGKLKKRIIVKDAVAGEKSRVVTFFVKGKALEYLKKHEIQKALEENSSSRQVVVGSANSENEVTPLIEVDTSFVKVDRQALDGDVNVIVPSGSRSLTFIKTGTISGPSQNTVKITTDPAAGSLIEPGKNVAFLVAYESNVAPGSYTFDAIFRDKEGYELKEPVVLTVDTSSTLTGNQGTPVLLLQPSTSLLSTQADTSIDTFNAIKVTNTSTRFDVKLKDSDGNNILQKLFSFSCDNVSIEEPDILTYDLCQYKAASIDPAKAKLGPGESCTLKLKVSGINTPGELCDIYTNETGNVKPGLLAKASIQESPNNAQVMLTHNVPKVFSGSALPYIQMEVKNTNSALLEIRSLDLSAMTDWKCTHDNGSTVAEIKNGDISASSPVSIASDSTWVLKCTIKNLKDVSGNIKAGFSGGQSYQSPTFNSYYLAESSLLPDKLRMEAPDGIHVGKITFVIKNESDESVAQGVNVDLGRLDNELGVGNKLELEQGQLGVKYTNGVLSLENDLLPGTEKSIILKLPLGAVDFLSSNKDAIKSNKGPNYYIKLTSVNNQPVYPNIDVDDALLSFNRLVDNFDEPTTKTFLFANKTGQTLSVTLGDLPEGITARLVPDGLKGNKVTPTGTGMVTVTSYDGVVPGDLKLPIKVIEASSASLINTYSSTEKNYTTYLTASVPPMELKMVSAGIARLPSGLHKTTTSIVLENSNNNGRGYTIEGVGSFAESLEVLDASGHAVPSDKITLGNERNAYISYTRRRFYRKRWNAQETDVLDKAAYGAQVNLGFTVNTQIPTGIYSLRSKEVGNIKAATIAYVNVRPAAKFFEITEKSHVPPVVLEDTPFTYWANIKNVFGAPVTVTGISEMPQGPHIKWDEATNSPFWNQGEESITLEPGASADLKFNQTLSAGETFQGKLAFNVKAKGIQNEMSETVSQFATRSENKHTPEKFAFIKPMIFVPGSMVEISFTAGSEGVNNLVLDIGTPVDTFNQFYNDIDDITLNDKSIFMGYGLPGKKIVTPVGSFFPGEKGVIKIKIRPSSYTDTLAIFASLIEKNAEPCSEASLIKLKASNMSFQCPPAIVYPQTIELVEKDGSGENAFPEQKMSIPKPFQKVFNLVNRSENPATLTSFTTHNTSGITVEYVDPCKNGSIIPGKYATNNQCLVKITVSDKATSKFGYLEIKYDINGTGFTSKITIAEIMTAAKLDLAPTSEQIKNYGVKNEGGLWLITRPSSGKALIRVKLTNIGDFSLYNKDVTLYSVIYRRPNNVGFPVRKQDETDESLKCKNELYINSSCFLNLLVYDTDTPNYRHSLNIDNLGTNIPGPVIMQYTVLSPTMGMLVAFDHNIHKVDKTDGVVLKPLKTSKEEITVKNVGGGDITMDDPAATIFTAPPAPSSPSMDTSDCDAKVLAPQATCKIRIQGPDWPESFKYHWSSEVLLRYSISSSSYTYKVKIDLPPLTN